MGVNLRRVRETGGGVRPARWRCGRTNNPWQKLKEDSPEPPRLSLKTLPVRRVT